MFSFHDSLVGLCLKQPACWLLNHMAVGLRHGHGNEAPPQEALGLDGKRPRILGIDFRGCRNVLHAGRREQVSLGHAELGNKIPELG
jgi:hypothetical protein